MPAPGSRLRATLKASLSECSIRTVDYLRFGVASAQRGWAEKADIINTYPLAKLRRYLEW